MVSHRQDRGVFNQFVNGLQSKLLGDFNNECEVLPYQTLEPELKHLGEALFLKNEAQVDSHQVLEALHISLKENSICRRVKAQNIKGYCVDGEKFDWVFDCRGLAANKDITGLHGVRGEVITVQALQVNLSRMVRVMHPRYRIYIVPRENQHYMIGATEIQSEDQGPVSVRSTLELLSAAFSVHSGFAEARIISLDSHVRPTTMDHQPYIDMKPGITRINGLYRHGFLLSPAIVTKVFKDFGIDNNDHFKQSGSPENNANCI